MEKVKGIIIGLWDKTIVLVGQNYRSFNLDRDKTIVDLWDKTIVDNFQKKDFPTGGTKLSCPSTILMDQGIALLGSGQNYRGL